MRCIVRLAGTALAAVLCLTTLAPPLTAQGVTTAAVRGRIIDEAGQPVQGAAVSLMNTSTGQRYQGISRADGRFNIENVAVGGPYTLESRLIGFSSAQLTDVVLTLNQVLELNLRMRRAAVELEAVTVTAEQRDPLLSVSRTGTAAFVSDSAIRRLPTLNRNFTDFVITAPQVAEADGLTLGGAHRKMNNVQIDGVSDNDLFGLGDTGQPGGQVGAKSISLEAVKEYQVLIAPFDVRQSGFAGGLINAVTKRGTNEYHGSAFWYFQDDFLVRDTLTVTRGIDTLLVSGFGQFRQHQRGFSFGGPIIRDKAHIFLSAEWQVRNIPALADEIGRNIASDTAQAVADIFQNTYGVNPGLFTASSEETPNRNIFGRFDFQLSDNHTLMLRWNHVNAAGDAIPRSSAGFYGFTSFNRTIRSNTNSVLAQLNSTLGGGKFYNELRIGWTRIRDRRRPEDLANRDQNVVLPQIEVRSTSNIGGSNVFNQFVVGGERFSHRNELDQDILEIDDALTFARGRHTVTIGTHNEWISFRNLFFHTADGRWRFNNLDALRNGTAAFFFAQIPYSDQAAGLPGNIVKGEPIADWGLFQLGGYVQDQWEVNPSLRLTLGLRVDVPILLDEPDLNPDLAASPIGISTNQMPTGNIHWAPRVGFNWDATGDRRTVVRGGAGIFTGRPPYVWLSNAYTNTGKEVLELFCSGGATPAFNQTAITDPSVPIAACLANGGVSVPAAQVNVFDTGFRFPQLLKTTLGIDQRLPFGILGTLELLYSRGVNTLQQQEMNIPQTAIRTNAEGRQMFGTINALNGQATPQKVDANFVQVLNHKNASKDWAYSITGQFQKRFSDGLEFNAGYTYTQVRDLTGLTSSIGTSNFGFNPVSRGGNPNDPELARSTWEIPHKITLSGTIDIPIPNVPSALTIIYTGQSGFPYTWTVSGDPNADGYEAPNIGGRRNDIAYVPLATGADFTPASPQDLLDYQALIDSEPCLQEARGSIPARNNCRNPWRNRLDMTLRASVGRVFGGQRHNLSLIWDVFNVLNLINSDWGLVKTVVFFSDPALEVEGYDIVNDRPIYSYIGPAPDRKESFSSTFSRWRMQLGLRWDF